MKRPLIRRFGTFGGVFTPTVLSIFGVILFLRSGWVVGNAGLFYAILVLGISEIISLATVLSISSISTNMRVETGGVYYIISRSLGIETGGAIGIPLYLSQAISVAFYVIGFTESIKWVFPSVNSVILSSLVLIIFTIIAYIGADFAIKVQYIILGILMLSILSFLIPGSWTPLHENIYPGFSSSLNFWKIFAVFFPAVTGITAGVSMSGELKKPEKNIPQGAIIAVIFTSIVYLLVFIKLSAIAHKNELISDSLILMKKAKVPIIVFLGIWSATLSSALTFIVGAPRTLQSLARDRVIPFFLASPLGSKKEEPRAGIILTFIIGEIFIIAGTLNMVATIITMFFLLTYTVINLSAGISSIVGQPFYRPRFKVHYSISIIGAILNYVVMFLINVPATLLATLSIIILYLILERRAITQTWGDLRTGIWLSIARFSLLKLEFSETHKNIWRPNLMVFSGNPGARLHLVRFANWLGRGNGIITLFNIVEGKPERDYRIKEERNLKLKEFISKAGLPAFSEVELVDSFYDDIKIITQSHGIGKLASNLALFGYPKDEERGVKLFGVVREMFYLKKDTLILRYDFEEGYRGYKNIDIWWGGKGGNDSLMLFIAYILQLNHEWRDSAIRVIRVVEEERLIEKARWSLEYVLSKARLKGNVVVEKKGDRSFKEILFSLSGNSSLVIMGLPVPEYGNEKKCILNIKEMIPSRGSFLFVRSSETKSIFE